MKKRYIIFILLMLFISINNIFAITSSSSSDYNKVSIYPYNSPTCADKEESKYNKFGGVYTAYVSEEDAKDDVLFESKAIYKTSTAATEVCSIFTKDNYISGTTDTYLCKGTVERTAYACSDVKKPAETSGAITGEINPDDYYGYYDELFTTESSCLLNCEGTCSMTTGYAYKYAIPADVTTVYDKASLHNITGKIFQTAEGDNAFCIQPGLSFTCLFEKGTNKPVANYCLNSEFDLGTCKDGYNTDYRCGLAHILLHAAGSDGKISNENYPAVDVALRMWAAQKGNLQGLDTLTVPTSKEAQTSKTFFFAITAQRIAQDSNYRSYGIKCSSSSKNSGVICDNGYTAYMQSIKLYYDALDADTLDENSNKVPRLITSSLGSSSDVVTMTNPTGETCVAGEKNCKVNIILRDSDGNIITKENSTYCDKNYCHAEVQTTKLCGDKPKATGYTAEVQIKHFQVGGKVREYYNCTKPDERQIMYVVEGEGTETTDNLYIKTFDVKVACECGDDSDNLKATVGYKNDNGTNTYISGSKDVHTCDNNTKMSTESNDYNGVEEGFIKDPSMAKILNSCSGEKYFREKSYETYSDTCHVYCRNEMTFYMANKEKVYSGMQFRYKLEEKITNNLDVDQHLTSIVHQKRQCVSEVFYDTPNPDIENKSMDTWLERYNAAQKKVAAAWNEWKIWEARLYYDTTDEAEPVEVIYPRTCSGDCSSYQANPDPSALHNDNEELDACYNIAKIKDLITLYSGMINNEVPHSACAAFNSLEASGPGICFPKCTSRFVWSANKAKNFDYASGKNIEVDYDKVVNGTHGVSSKYCKTQYVDCDFVIKGVLEDPDENGNYDTVNFTYDTDRNGRPGMSANAKYLFTGNNINYNTATNINAADEEVEYKVDKIKNILLSGKKYSNKTITSIVSKCESSDLVEENLGTCSEGVEGDEFYVKKMELKTRNAYSAAQKAVQDLLTGLQNCNMFGSGLVGEPSIVKYTLTVNPASSGGGNSNGNGYGADANVGTNGTGAATIDKTLLEGQPDTTSPPEPDPGPAPEDSVETTPAENVEAPNGLIITDKDKTVKNVSTDVVDALGNKVEYNASDMTADPNTKYTFEDVATTGNSKSMKRKLLSYASCTDDNCVDLNVKYADTVFGTETEYSKVARIIETDDVFNVYCEKNNSNECFRVAEIDDDIKSERDGWKDEPYYSKTVNRIVCDNSDSDPLKKECKLVATRIPTSDYIAFTITTEVDFYRPKAYYTKAFTGEVIETKENTKMNSKIYSKLGKNVYPVSNDKENGKTGIYPVNYTFSNINLSKFGSKSDTINLDKYNYQCAYEVYNNTTGYDCEIKYDDEGNPMPSECSNFCLYVEGSVPDLECIQWNNTTDSKGYGFIYRNVDLSNLFPNGREYGNNWSNAEKIISDIQSSADEIFTDESHLELSVTLTSDAIKKIREYNRYKNTNAGGYLDNSIGDCDTELSLDGKNYRFANCRSTFIDEIQSGSGVLGIKSNKIVRSGSDVK